MGASWKAAFTEADYSELHSLSIALLKKIENVDYCFDPAAEATNTNVMDRWILASCQSLLKFVNEEMAGEHESEVHVLLLLT